MFVKHVETELTETKKQKEREIVLHRPLEGTLVISVVTPGKEQMLCSPTLGKKSEVIKEFRVQVCQASPSSLSLFFF